MVGYGFDFFDGVLGYFGPGVGVCLFGGGCKEGMRLAEIGPVLIFSVPFDVVLEENAVVVGEGESFVLYSEGVDWVVWAGGAEG